MSEKTYREALNWFKTENIIAQEKTTKSNVSYFLNILKLSSGLNPPKYIKNNYPKSFDLIYTLDIQGREDVKLNLDNPFEIPEDVSDN